MSVTEWKPPSADASGGASQNRVPKFRRVADNEVFAQYRTAAPAPAAQPAKEDAAPLAADEWPSAPPAAAATQPAVQAPHPAPSPAIAPHAPAPAVATGSGSAVSEADPQRAELAALEAAFAEFPTELPKPSAEYTQYQQPITYPQALHYFSNTDWRAALHAGRTAQQPTHSQGQGLLSRLKRGRLTGRLEEEMEFVLALQKLKLNHECVEHYRILNTIHQRLTGDPRSVSGTGGHWEKLGFQGNDPGTDLRSSGMLGLLQLLHLVANTALAPAMFKTATSPQWDFPFALCGINFTVLGLELLKEGRLNKLINKRGGVLDLLNAFYVGLFVRFHTIWRSHPQRAITEWDEVRRQLKQFARDYPQRVLEEASE